jgi:hypothetical protein
MIEEDCNSELLDQTVEEESVESGHPPPQNFQVEGVDDGHYLETKL